VPAINEEGSIDWVLEQLPDWIAEVVLIDGLSTDRTELIARSRRPQLVVVHQRIPGKGAALRAGFAAATSDIVVSLDADGSTNPAEIERFVDALQAGAHFVKGTRHAPGGGSADFTLLRRAGNKTFVALANWLYGSQFTDLCYGYCAFWRRHLDALGLTANGFEIETQLVLNAVKAGLVIREVPSFELRRRAGKSNLHVYRDGRRVLATLLRERPAPDARSRPARFDLREVTLAAPATAAWRPAGLDRRRGDRRSAGSNRYTGAERRALERRVRPLNTSTVLVAAPVQMEDPRPRGLPRRQSPKEGESRQLKASA
jgi:hypothetical protein